MNVINQVGGVYNAVQNVTLRTNTSGQIRAISSTANTTLQLATTGWIDTRGRLQ